MVTFPLALRNAQLDAKNAKVLLEMSRDADLPADTRPLSRLGDEQQLRGIPVIGRGVAGAVRVYPEDLR